MGLGKPPPAVNCICVPVGICVVTINQLFAGVLSAVNVLATCPQL